ncbi:hypothetical protein NJF44_10575 [Pseudomonas guariconensis]|uniref:hypothetical protein n=1 Tax=Pseudomonas TaxID=286 RepID=UPI002098279F|nr:MULTISPECIES: hypothetical protein [Pseudomonas]MCO7515734.1 hypothetical protein [Pseudomonas putida]MCO7595039.1 hypothetical protein [Pseudomonas guariconensis]MCO7605673.1 hypothetical protein [Pseudomonas guariconensis]MCU7221082.1 hypothetical protein [Pseudomonas brassicacearum]
MTADKDQIIKALTGEEPPFKSPFVEGLEAAADGTAWTQCPYVGASQDYERGEWLRGHSAHGRWYA